MAGRDRSSSQAVEESSPAEGQRGPDAGDVFRTAETSLRVRHAHGQTLAIAFRTQPQ